jgi:PLAT/LH2 domain
MKTLPNHEVTLQESKNIKTPGFFSHCQSKYRLVAPPALLARAHGSGLLSVLLACAAGLAYAQPLPERQTLGPEVTIVADRGAVRFATLEGTPVAHLKVYTPTGEQVFESGAGATSSLEWQGQDQQGQRVAPGQYVYHLTSKDQSGASWLQQGQLIVNRTSDDDSFGIVSDSPFGRDTPLILQETVRRSEVKVSLQEEEEEPGFEKGRAKDSRVAITSLAAGQVTYKITIQTSTLADAGTDANVYIRLFGPSTITPIWLLDNPNRNDFERGSTDVFYLTSPDLSALTSLSISQDNTGNKPGWNISWITVQNMSTGQQWYFPACRWLAKDSCGTSVSLLPNRYPSCALCY